jgi:hypothetical protein
MDLEIQLHLNIFSGSSKQFRTSDKKWHLSLRRYSNFQPLLTFLILALSYHLTTREIKGIVDIKVVRVVN